VISCRQATKRFGSLTAVDELTLTVEHGRVLGFLGPNGAGKTTAIRMLLGLIAPSAGSITVLGLPPGSPHLAGRVGALVEEPALYPWLSGRQNLLVMAESGPELTKHATDEALDRVRLTGAGNQKVRSYSQGMRQRLGLAAAIMRKPDLVILDEPTNGLDPVGIREFRGLVESLVSDGATLLISSHLLAEVQQVCSDVVVLSRGRVVANGPVSELRASGAAGTRVSVAPEDEQSAVVALADLDVRRESSGRFLVRGSSSADVLRALYAAGVRIDSVASADDLEALFLSLTGGESGDAPAAR
jgi:ABC-2 type transport system ATP-binding protein